MDTRVSDSPLAGRPGRGRVIRKALVAVLVMGTLAWCLSHYQQTVGHNAEPAGFGEGLLHGAVMPCAMPLLLFGQDLNIYAPKNDGRSYKLGYTMGVNICGLVFFGILFARLSRWRKRLAKPVPEN